MCTFRLGFLFVYSLVFFRLNAALSLDRINAAVTPGQLTHTQTKAQTIEHQRPDLAEYEDGHYEDDFSGDHDLEYPRVEFSSKPKSSGGVAKADSTKKPRRRKNLCLRKRNENYCIYGVCEYLVQLKEISCRCNDGYTGERCQHLILFVATLKEDQYNHVTLAIVASVLSVLSLIIIGTLLILRHYRKNNCEGEEKIRLEAAPVQ